MTFRDILMASAAGNGAFGGGTWTPLALGTSLLAWWSAERTDLITKDGSNLVSSWRDVVNGYDLSQATGTAQPVWSATGFNTRPAITADGTDDFLALTPLPDAMPIGATPVEEWYAVDQKNLAALTASTFFGTEGGASNGNTRGILRAVVSGVNRARATDSGTAVTEGTIDFSGRHVVRSIFNGTTIGVEVDGTAATPVAVTPAVNASRIRMFCSQSASNFANIAVADRLFTGLLTAGQATQLRNFLSRGV